MYFTESISEAKKSSLTSPCLGHSNIVPVGSATSVGVAGFISPFLFDSHEQSPQKAKAISHSVK